MSESEAPPPAYGAASAGRPAPPDSEAAGILPTYSPPTQFTIGSATTREPLVKIIEIKGHLALLQAFTDLKNRVESLQDLPKNVPVDTERRWAWFVGIAVERFDIWCQNLKTTDISQDIDVVLPPMDVLMVWHSYMLNPRSYAEDCMRINACEALKGLEGHFARLLEDPTSPILTASPSNDRIEFWRSRTSLSFDALEDMHTMTTKVISCPKCRAAVQVDFLNPLGTGYLQQKFSAMCVNPGCDFGEITKAKLALRKLAQDLAANISLDPSSHLAGTIFDESDAKKGNTIKKLICDAAQPFYTDAPLTSYVTGSSQYREQLCLAIMKRAKYSIADLRTLTGKIYFTQPRLNARIMAAYNDDKIYSVELVGAVLRQGSFVRKMHNLGWTRPGFFDLQSDELALQHALARYHAFLDLMSSSPASFFVPTLDIDLVWHTHQLLPGKYNSDCREYVKRFIDHDDKVEGLRLSSAFDITCRVWKERFHVEYTHCGCPIPGDSIGQRLSRMVGAYHGSPPSHLVPFERPDLLSATHASDHNAVRFVAKDERAHKLTTQRYELLAKKKQKAKEKAEKKAAKSAQEAAKMHGRDIKAKSKQEEALGAYHDSETRSPSSRAYQHDMAFLVPVPIFFGTGLLVAGSAGVACVAADGTFANQVGGCSNCGGGGGCGGGACAAGSSGGACGGGGGGCGGGGCGGGGCGGCGG